MWSPKALNSQLSVFWDFLRTHRLRQPWWALPLTHEEPAYFEIRRLELLDFLTRRSIIDRQNGEMMQICWKRFGRTRCHVATSQDVAREMFWFFAYFFSRVSMANNLAVKDSFCVSQLNTSLMYFPTPINNTYVGHLHGYLGQCAKVCTQSHSTWKYTVYLVYIVDEEYEEYACLTL